jgi:hypothetical protein
MRMEKLERIIKIESTTVAVRIILLGKMRRKNKRRESFVRVMARM